ncbi:MAG: 16S rRNA (guanine(527)-N(7))-methyltransferase RsmG [Anaerolineales bacterium]|nr:16S rRNA (guanine(527)-N(7))-methyltransferase RsmG [Anaerolineales bacterium]
MELDLLIQETAKLGIVLTAVQLQQFAHYQALLLAWNKQMNLTAIREPADIQLKHFLDSLTCASVMGDLAQTQLLDVGTGAGFPGLPLKILVPELHVTLVESVAKKTRFLEVVVAELGLTGVEIIAERAEVLGQHAQHRERYDWVVARAVAELRVLLEYLLPFCRVGGHVLAQKGENASAEIANAQNALAVLGAEEPHLHTAPLPESLGPRFFVVVPKVAAMPALYPRRAGMPGKRPL